MPPPIKRIEMFCRSCRVQMWVIPALIQRNKRYCSRACQYADEDFKKSLGRSGVNASNWKGGVTYSRRLFRKSHDYRKWRQAILKRDDYRCFDCGERSEQLDVDHIFSFALYPRLRIVPENGITRCRPCHRMTKTYGVPLERTPRRTCAQILAARSRASSS